jgi:hypothetical protein
LKQDNFLALILTMITECLYQRKLIKRPRRV